MTALIFIIVLAVLIFVHELGHFLAARLCGIRVDQFKLGFGPKIVRWTRGETEYGINLIPFGGFVKIHGENPDDESTQGADAARSFVNKSRWKQALVLVAGVGFNFIFAWLLYVIGFMSGMTVVPDDFSKYADRMEHERIMITYVSPDSPAATAGFKPGDVIDAVTGSMPTSEDPRTIQDIQEFIDLSGSGGGEKIDFSISRPDGHVSISVVPAEGLVEGKHAIGIGMQEVSDLRLPVISAIVEGFRYMIVMTRETVVGLGGFLINIFRGTADFSDVAGPVGIAGIVGDAANLGFVYLLMITALISINLGVINLIPFPALDGGRLLFVAIEGVIRRRIPMKVANTVNAVGFILLMILMVVITYKDVARLFR